MKKPFRQKRLKIPTPESLGNAALAYLARMAASEASLRRVLENRLRRAQRLDTAFAADAAKQTTLRSAIDTIIEKHRRLGTLNDAAYAESRVSSLRRAGRSRRFIQQAMNLKGIDAALTNDALSVSDDGREPGEAERQAARAFAKRRRLGPFRTGKTDDDRRRKDLAALARAGFSLSIAREVLGGTLGEEIENEDF